MMSKKKKNLHPELRPYGIVRSKLSDKLRKQAFRTVQSDHFTWTQENHTFIIIQVGNISYKPVPISLISTDTASSKKFTCSSDSHNFAACNR